MDDNLGVRSKIRMLAWAGLLVVATMAFPASNAAGLCYPDPLHPPQTCVTTNICTVSPLPPACVAPNCDLTTLSCVNCSVIGPGAVNVPCCAIHTITDPTVCVPPPPCTRADADHECDCGTEPGDPADLCTTDSCLADALVIDESDILGGASHNVFSESRIASITPVAGIYALPPPPYPSPPPTSMVHADAQTAGVHYVNGFLGVSVAASTIFSRCDMNAVNDPTGLYADTYGRGGIQDLQVTVSGQTLDLTALDFELQAFGAPTGVTAAWTCDLADVGLNNPPPSAVAAICAGIPNVGTGIVNVIYNQVDPPAYDPVSGNTYYVGTHLHVQIITPLGAVDIYEGHVQVAVMAGPPGPAPAPAAAAATYLAHGPCLTPVCT